MWKRGNKEDEALLTSAAIPRRHTDRPRPRSTRYSVSTSTTPGLVVFVGAGGVGGGRARRLITQMLSTRESIKVNSIPMPHPTRRARIVSLEDHGEEKRGTRGWGSQERGSKDKSGEGGGSRRTYTLATRS